MNNNEIIQWIHYYVSIFTSTNAGYAGSVHAINVSDGKLLPCEELALTNIMYCVFGVKL